MSTSCPAPRLFGFNRHELTSSAVLSYEELLRDVQLLKDGRTGDGCLDIYIYIDIDIVSEVFFTNL